MEYREILLPNLAFKYIIYENGDVYKISKRGYAIKIKPNRKQVRFRTKDKKYISIYLPYVLAGAFYGGLLPRRKVRFLKVNQPLHISNIVWYRGFEKGIDYNYINSLQEKNLTEEDKNIRLYLLTKEYKFLNKVIDANKGLYYHIFKESGVIEHFNEFVRDLQIKIFKMADAGLLKPEEHSNRMKSFFRLVCKYYIFNIFTKKQHKKEVEYKDYKTTNLSYDFGEDFNNLDDEIDDMFNYFSS